MHFPNSSACKFTLGQRACAPMRSSARIAVYHGLSISACTLCLVYIDWCTYR